MQQQECLVYTYLYLPCFQPDDIPLSLFLPSASELWEDYLKEVDHGTAALDPAILQAVANVKKVDIVVHGTETLTISPFPPDVGKKKIHFGHLGGNVFLPMVRYSGKIYVIA